MKRVLLSLLLLLLAAGQQAAADDLTPVAREVAQRINRAREQAGLPPYRLSSLLTRAAQQHAEEMLHSGQYSHISPDGSTLRDRLRRIGYPFLDPQHPRAGENWGLFPTVAKTVQWWLDDSPHRHNILHPVYQEMGIGVVRHPWGYLTVVDFALPAANADVMATVNPMKALTPLPTLTAAATSRPRPSLDLDFVVRLLAPAGALACPYFWQANGPAH